MHQQKFQFFWRYLKQIWLQFCEEALLKYNPNKGNIQSQRPHKTSFIFSSVTLEIYQKESNRFIVLQGTLHKIINYYREIYWCSLTLCCIYMFPVDLRFYVLYGDRTAKSLTAKCPHGEVSLRRSVLTAKCPTAKSPTAKRPVTQ